MTAQNMLASLECSAGGLTGREAASRLARYGPNALTEERSTALRVVARQFQSALIYFLAVAAALSFGTGDLSDGVIITAILIINAALGFSQEFRSERAIEKLSKVISHNVAVHRDGQPTSIPVADLVPGDVVVVKEGDIVPADLKVLSTDNVEVDESQLTGESVPVPKSAEGEAAHEGGSLLFTGSTVVRGEATGLCFSTANTTELGKVAALSTSVRRVTQYEQSLRAFSLLLMKIIGASLAATLLVKLLSSGGGTPISKLVIFVIVLAVAVVPEALPVISTLTLAVWGCEARGGEGRRQAFVLIGRPRQHHVALHGQDRDLDREQTDDSTSRLKR